jgi:hypothetical protein
MGGRENLGRIFFKVDEDFLETTVSEGNTV